MESDYLQHMPTRNSFPSKVSLMFGSSLAKLFLVGRPERILLSRLMSIVTVVRFPSWLLRPNQVSLMMLVFY